MWIFPCLNVILYHDTHDIMQVNCTGCFFCLFFTLFVDGPIAWRHGRHPRPASMTWSVYFSGSSLSGFKARKAGGGASSGRWPKWLHLFCFYLKSNGLWSVMALWNGAERYVVTSLRRGVSVTLIFFSFFFIHMKTRMTVVGRSKATLNGLQWLLLNVTLISKEKDRVSVINISFDEFKRRQLLLAFS